MEWVVFWQIVFLKLLVLIHSEFGHPQESDGGWILTEEVAGCMQTRLHAPAPKAVYVPVCSTMWGTIHHPVVPRCGESITLLGLFPVSWWAQFVLQPSGKGRGLASNKHAATADSDGEEEKELMCYNGRRSCVLQNFPPAHLKGMSPIWTWGPCCGLQHPSFQISFVCRVVTVLPPAPNLSPAVPLIMKVSALQYRQLSSAPAKFNLERFRPLLI